MTDSVVVTLHGFAHGGEAVGRMPDGKAVFVGHAIPGETVRIRVVEEHKRWCRAELVDVVDASPDRVEPPCVYFGPGRCGGCTLQHISGDRRRDLQRQVVVDQLERLGRIPDPNVTPTVPAGDYGYRSRARFSPDDGGALGFRRHASHEVVPVDRCLLLDEPTHRLRMQAGDSWQEADHVEVRTGTEGEAVVVTSKRTPTPAMGDAVLTEHVDGLTFRVSATSFFQANRAGAEHLLRLVLAAAAVGPGDTALDLYAGVGLFAAGLARAGAAVTAVEGSRDSAADARHNLAGTGAEVIRAPVEAAVANLRRRSATYSVVVLDPPRKGAGKRVVEAAAELAERTIVIVACDPAALGRDAGHLAGAGWQLRQAVPVDQFAQTGHIEVVATFQR